MEVFGKNLLDDPAIGGLVVNMSDISERKRFMAELERLSETDVLTDTFNRRGFMRLAEREFERARRSEQPLTLVMIDIDHFKAVNDSFGHAAGDMILASVADCCRRHVRSIDILARFGGEEFIVLVVDASIEAAEKIAGRLHQGIAESRATTIKGDVSVTASFGIAMVDPNGSTLKPPSALPTRRFTRRKIRAETASGHEPDESFERRHVPHRASIARFLFREPCRFRNALRLFTLVESDRSPKSPREAGSPIARGKRELRGSILAVIAVAGLALRRRWRRRCPRRSRGRRSQRRRGSAGADRASLQRRSASRRADGQVFLLRGLVNVFSLGMDTLARKIRAKDIPVRVTNFTNWRGYAAVLVDLYRATGRLPRW